VRVPITLEDITPPTIDVFLDSNANPHTSFGGITRYPASAVVLPVITVSDACDPNPTFDELILDGQPYTLATPISGVGLHILNARVSDASGNASDLTTIFEIRERPSYTGAAVVQSTHFDLNGNGHVTHFEATVLFSASEFDHRDIYLPSVRMVLRDAEGDFIAVTPIPIKGGYPIGCDIFHYELAEVTTNDCYLVATLEADFAEPLDAPPAELILVGAGISNSALSFEWGARTDNIADPNAVQTLLGEIGEIGPCGDPEPPQPVPSPPCQFVKTVIFPPGATCTAAAAPIGGAACAPGSGSSSNSSAYVHAVGGYSLSTVTTGALPVNAFCSASGWCGSRWSGIIVAQLVGDCCNCAITIDASTSIKATAQVFGGGAFVGSATASGKVKFAAPCGTVTVSALSPIVNVSTNTRPISVPGSGALACVDRSCSSYLIIDSTAWVDTKAQAWWSNSWCEAQAWLSSSPGNLSVTGTAVACNPPVDCDDP
jgi:hypothetical protein